MKIENKCKLTLSKETILRTAGMQTGIRAGRLPNSRSECHTVSINAKCPKTIVQTPQ